MNQGSKIKIQILYIILYTALYTILYIIFKKAKNNQSWNALFLRTGKLKGFDLLMPLGCKLSNKCIYLCSLTSRDAGLQVSKIKTRYILLKSEFSKQPWSLIKPREYKSSSSWSKVILSKFAHLDNLKTL